jgi:hypothetical protein
MSEFYSWAEQNWQPLGALLVQLAFLVTGVWFARNILKTIRAFQEQVGALLKHTITATPDEQHLAGTTVKQSLEGGRPDWLTPSETQTVGPPASTASGPGRVVVAWRRLVLWMQAPMSTTTGTPWPRVIRWFQAPIGAPASGRKGVSSDLATPQPLEYAGSGIIGLGIADTAQAQKTLDSSVNQALGGRLTRC